MKTLNVLIVEDDLAFQRLIHRALTRNDPATRITMTSDATSFLAALQRETPDCIVMDFNLGDDRATDVIRQAGPSMSRIPVPYISAAIRRTCPLS